MNYKRKIVINTLAQHTKTILNVCMSLYSTRLILSALGNSDFGIFSLIGNMVAMLGFLTNALVITTQRHLSYYQDKDKNTMRIIFSNSLFIHIVLGIILTIILLAVEPLLFDRFLRIERCRIDAASYVYQLMVVVLFLTFIASPFRALFIARENIVYISVIDFFDGLFKLILAFVLLHLQSDKLITYAWMITCISLFNLIAFITYAKINFKETIILPKRSYANISSIYKILSFAGWTTYSTGCIIGRTQGMAIILNNFFGTIINTSWGIASQVSGALQFISQAILNAISPQIIKAEGNNERQRMLFLSEIGSKYSCLLLSMAAIPLFFEMPEILKLWLGYIPPQATIFCRFILIASVIDQTTIGLGIANQAIGKIRTYSIIINTIKILTLPVAWVCLKIGLPIVSTMWCYVIVEAICAIARLPFLHFTAELSITHYINNVIFKLILPLLALTITSWVVTNIIQLPFRFVITICLSIVTCTITIWTTSISRNEKKTILNMIKKQ